MGLRKIYVLHICSLPQVIQVYLEERTRLCDQRWIVASVINVTVLVADKKVYSPVQIQDVLPKVKTLCIWNVTELDAQLNVLAVHQIVTPLNSCIFKIEASEPTVCITRVIEKSLGINASLEALNCLKISCIEVTLTSCNENIGFSLICLKQMANIPRLLHNCHIKNVLKLVGWQNSLLRIIRVVQAVE